jgi:hypothetical protein
MPKNKNIHKIKTNEENQNKTQDNLKPFIEIECNKHIIYFSQLFDLRTSQIH